MEVEDPRLGTVLQGRYRIVERLAAGGMGVVYRGERVKLERQVAIKFLHATVAAQAKAMKRFEREARIMGRMAHPHCVSVIDVGVEELPYIVMDYVSGRDLKELLAGGPLPVARAVRIARQILAGLAHAHALGVVHRDIKPANIMIADAEGTRDHVYVLDFGLAKFRENALGDDVTGSAALIGTPSYMAPEQARGQQAGEAADMYSTGVLLFEMLTGDNPFRADNPIETVLRHQELPAPGLRDTLADAPAGLERILQTAMAKEPDQRFPSVLAFIEALDEVMDAQPALPRAASAGAPAEEPAGEELAGDAAPAAEEKPARADDATEEQPGEEEGEESDEGPDEGEGPDESGVSAEEPDITSLRDAPPTVPVPTVPEDMDVERPRRVPAGIWLVLLPALSAALTWHLVQRGNEAERAQLSDADRTAVALQPEAGPTLLGAAAQPADAAVPTDAAIDARPDAAIDAQVDAAIDAQASVQAAAEPSVADAGAGPVDAALPAPETVQARSVRDVYLLVRQGQRDQAIVGIRKLLPDHAQSAYLYFLLGNLYFEKTWWSQGLDAYRSSIAKNAFYAGKAIVSQNAIQALGSPRTRAKATRLIVHTLGKHALPHLGKAAKTHADPTVRKRAAALARRIKKK